MQQNSQAVKSGTVRRLPPPIALQSLLKASKWRSALGIQTEDGSTPKMIQEHTFMPVYIDVAGTDEKQWESFIQGRAATIKLSIRADVRAGTGLWSPAAGAVAAYESVPGMMMLMVGEQGPGEVRLKMRSKAEGTALDELAQQPIGYYSLLA